MSFRLSSLPHFFLAGLVVAGFASMTFAADDHEGKMDAAMKASHAKVHMACHADMEKFCKGVKMDDMRACMMKHESELSPDCKKAHDEHSAMHSKSEAHH